MDVLRAVNLPQKVLGAIVNLNGPGHYVHWGFIQISVANLLVIATMVVVFLAAILIPFPGGRGRHS